MIEIILTLIQAVAIGSFIALVCIAIDKNAYKRGLEHGSKLTKNYLTDNEAWYLATPKKEGTKIKYSSKGRCY